MSVATTLRSTPVRLALVLAAALSLGLACLGIYIGYDANRILAARTQSTVDADVAFYKALATANGLDALEAALTARSSATADGAMLHVLTKDTALRSANIALDFERPPSSGAVFRYTPRGVTSDNAIRFAYGRTLDLGGATYLTIARDIEAQGAFARRLQRTLLLGLAALGIAALIGGIALGRALDRRLARINATATAIMAGDLSRRIERDGSGDELDRLAARLNDMLTRIDDLMQALRDVSDNIAHDLKTPINRLRNTAEAALSAAPAAQQAALGGVIEQADAIIQTFNALLLIARLDHGGADVPPPEPVVLAELVEDIADLYEPVAEDAKLTFRLVVTDRVRYLAHRQLMTQAIANLVDNAIKYAGDPTRDHVESLSLTVVALPTDVQIIVSDRGPGIAEGDRATALKRFGRLDKSRSLPGTGLGLSLVAAIARLHGGQLLLGDNNPGLRATISLPRAKIVEP